MSTEIILAALLIITNAYSYPSVIDMHLVFTAKSKQSAV